LNGLMIASIFFMALQFLLRRGVGGPFGSKRARRGA